MSCFRTDSELTGMTSQVAGGFPGVGEAADDDNLEAWGWELHFLLEMLILPSVFTILELTTELTWN